MAYLLSHYHARPLLAAWERGEAAAEVSLDLGLTAARVALDERGVTLPDGQALGWDVIAEIAEAESACYVIEDGRAEKVQFFSEELGRVYTLWPTERAPTMLVSGIPMHRIKGVDPLEDTRRKLRALGPARGRVLDTATGLGYTAIEAAKTASEVVTIELDPKVLEVARLNPWSRELFENPRITRLTGDAFEVVDTLEPESFDAVLHDPPQFSLAGELYSAEFYGRLHRVLKPRGRLFHYIGDPESRSGAGVTRGVIRRLEEAGFRNVTRRPEAFGVVARK
jgi:uncharacterized protein